MPKRKNLAWWATGSAALFLLIGGWTLYRYYVGDTILTLDGRTVRDLSVAEVGGYAGSDFAKARQAYLTYLPQYRNFANVSVSADGNELASQVRQVIRDALAGDATSKRVVDSLPNGAVDDLCRRIGFTLRSVAGMPADDYLAAVRDEDLEFDPRAADMAEYRLGRPLATTAASSRAEKDAEFRLIYNVPQTFDGGGRVIDAWAGASRGTRCVARPVPTATMEVVDLLYDALSPEERAFFRGKLHFGASISHGPAQDRNRIRVDNDALVHFEIITILGDRSGDAYPVTFRFAYLPDARRWWLAAVIKQASPRAANAPTFVF